MKMPYWASRMSWKQGDRVIVAIGEHRGRHGTVYLRAEKSNYLVLLDGEIRSRKFQKGALDPE